MDSDNAPSDKLECGQDLSLFRHAAEKPTPPTTPSPVPSVTGSDVPNSSLHAGNKILGHNYNGTGE